MINFTFKAKYIKSQDVWCFSIDNKSTGKDDIIMSDSFEKEIFKIFQHMLMYQIVDDKHKHLFVVLTNPDAPTPVEDLLTIKNLN